MRPRRFWVLPLLLAAAVPSLPAQEPAPMPKDAGPVKAPRQPEVVTHAALATAALEDAAALDPGEAAETRYLDARNVSPDHVEETLAVLKYHLNQLSREVKFTGPRRVRDWLYAVRMSDYDWDAKAWEGLAGVNVYHNINVVVKTPIPEKTTVDEKYTEEEKVPVKKTRIVQRPNGAGGYINVQEEYTDYEVKKVEKVRQVEKTVADKVKEQDDVLPAPWLPGKEMGGLIKLTGSKVPIVRADYFINQTAVQQDRDGHGYYDFLKLKAREDAEKLAVLDRKAAAKIYRELGAIAVTSGVTLNNRQLFRIQALTGPWWESRDTKDNKGTRNAANNLLDKYTHDAEEIVFTLPNGLPAFHLNDNKGAQAKTAPDFIAGTTRTTNNDTRIHVGYSCIVCHNEGGLRSIRDYSRKLYDPATGISLATLALDEKESKRLESVYLGPLKKNFDADSAAYGEATQDVCGLTPAKLSKAFESVWTRYLDEPVTVAKAAAETGHTVEDFKKKLTEYATPKPVPGVRSKKVVNPVIVAYLAADPLPVRREHFEEHFGLLMLILEGANP